LFPGDVGSPTYFSLFLSPKDKYPANEKGKRYKVQDILLFDLCLLSRMCSKEKNGLRYSQVFFSISEGFLAFWAEIFILRIAIGKHVTLDNTGIT